MGIKTITVIATMLTLGCTSAFAGTATEASFVKPDAPHAVHVVKAPVLLEASATKTKTLRIKRIVVRPVEALVARQASTVDHSPFVLKAEKKTRGKTYRPVASSIASKSASMPNLFTK